MARPPKDSRRTGVAGGSNRLAADDFAFLIGLEAAIDRALDGHRAGESFVYGVHQEISAPVVEALQERYRSAGWSEVRIRRGETGAHTVVLIP